MYVHTNKNFSFIGTANRSPRVRAVPGRKRKSGNGRIRERPQANLSALGWIWQQTRLLLGGAAQSAFAWLPDAIKPVDDAAVTAGNGPVATDLPAKPASAAYHAVGIADAESSIGFPRESAAAGAAKPPLAQQSGEGGATPNILSMATGPSAPLSIVSGSAAPSVAVTGAATAAAPDGPVGQIGGNGVVHRPVFSLSAEFHQPALAAGIQAATVKVAALAPSQPAAAVPQGAGTTSPAVTTDVGSVVNSGGETCSLSSLFTVSPGSSHPAYLVLTGLDRNEYTAASTGATGAITGNGATDHLTGSGNSDARTLGIVFTYDAANGRYYNPTYGYFDAATYTASNNPNDVTDLAVYGTNNALLANACANNSASLNALSGLGVGGTSYCGTVTVATETGYSATVPSQATPNSLVAVAQGFVGKSWNMDGCWVLASTIAAEAGASLPIASTDVGTPGTAGGEWVVAYNGPVSASSNWTSQVKAGEFVVFETASGTGHITFVASGSGSNAMLIDNITYEDANGKILNSANDGSSSDITISSAHSASQEWAGVSASSVVIYELDTPVVTPTVANATVAPHSSLALAPLFSVTDPANKPITQYQIYNTNSGDNLVVDGVAESAHSATTAVTVSSLSQVSLAAGSSAGADTVEVRAYNGSYWGDWNSLTVTVGGASATPSSGIAVNTTATHSLTEGENFSFALPANTFTDVSAHKIATAAYQTAGALASTWLHYDAATESFSGTAPSGVAETLTIDVVATDSLGHTAHDIFTVTTGGGAATTVVGAAGGTQGEHVLLG